MITDNELDRFFREYYSLSDIDIACNHDNIIDFIDHVIEVRNILHFNLQKHIGTSIRAPEIIPCKSLAIFINTNILKEKCNKKEIPYDYEFIINNTNNKEVRWYFYEMYLEIKKPSNVTNRKIIGDKISLNEYFEIIKYCDFDKVTLIINDFACKTNFECKTHNRVELMYAIPYNTDIFMKFSETLKYKVTSKYINHTLEFFKINEKEFFSTVSRFHLPCVRSYYNGVTCYMLPSAVTAYHTLVNIDFKYFVGSHDPINILEKYRSRGYGFIMNKYEIQQYTSYIKVNELHKKKYCLKDDDSIEKILGELDINHEFFKLRKNSPEEFYLPKNESVTYNNVNINFHIDALKFYYHNNTNTNILKEIIDMKPIVNGKVEPVKKWVIDAVFEK